jgi:hypothetical protein
MQKVMMDYGNVVANIGSETVEKYKIYKRLMSYSAKAK